MSDTGFASDNPTTPPANYSGLPHGAGTDCPIAVLGWGRSGKAAASALTARGLRVHVYDQKEPEETPTSLAAFDVITDAEQLAAAVIADAPGLIIVSPGIPCHAPIFNAAAETNIPVWGEVELAWQLQESGDNRGRPWLVVTGTNGKTTTVGLLGSMLRAAGKTVAEVGNIGTPIVEAVDSPAEVFAVELSSFQLYTTYSLSPLASVCLNVDADHVDWHGSVQAYAEAKARVYENTQVACVYPVGDIAVESMVAEADVVEGARAIGFTLGTPAPSQFGLVKTFW